jgi:predicted transcriptional regulator
MVAMARPKGAKKRRGVSYRLPEDLLDQLDKLTEKTRRTATAELEIALEAHLAAEGLWPPTEEKKQPKK